MSTKHHEQKTTVSSLQDGRSATVFEKESANQEARIEFPWKLHQLLEDAEENNMDREIISWLPCGRAFKIHNKIKFAASLMQKYFKTSNYKSFHRSLNMWGFETARKKGPHKGACYHLLFIRGHPDSCYRMKRYKIKCRIDAKTNVPSTFVRPVADDGGSANIISAASVPTTTESVGTLVSSLTTAARLMVQGTSSVPVATGPGNREVLTQLVLTKLYVELARIRHPVQVPLLAPPCPLSIQPQYLGGELAQHPSFPMSRMDPLQSTTLGTRDLLIARALLRDLR